MNGRSIAAAAAMLVTGFFMPAANSAEINVLGSPAFRESYLELVPQFEKASGHKVVTRWAGTADIMKSVQAGDSADLVILSRSRLDELAALGKIVPASRTDLAKSGVGVAVRTGAPRPDISSGEALKRALLAAKSVGYSSGPSGDYVVALFQRLGIAEQIKGKLKKTPPGVAVGGLIANGEVEIGFQQVSELLAVKGIDLVGPLSPDVQQITVFSAGIQVTAKQPEAARQLVRFLTSPESVPVKKKHGMEPG